MSASSILFEVNNNLAIIRLNRPDVLNSFNRDMAFELQKALQKCDEDSEIRAIYLTGNGRAFCAGQDLEEVVSDGGPELKNIVSEHYNPIVLMLRKIEKPVICFVNGVAAGAGANIALACDIVFAAKESSFIQAFSKIGLIPDSGGTFTLPRLIGLQRASALMMLGDKISAVEAESMGMIYKSIEATEEGNDNEAFVAAEKLSKMPTVGLGLTKRALNVSLNNSLEDQLKVEERLQTFAGTTQDYQEGVQAFLEKRKADFKGK